MPGARSKARKRAVDLLYEAAVRRVDPAGLVAERAGRVEGPGAGQQATPLPAYAVELIEGVTAQRDRIEELLTSYAEGWSPDRMPPVDRAVLQIALYELLWRDDVPDAVAIDEAVELAKTLSTDDSPRFVNGLLGRVARTLRADQPH